MTIFLIIVATYFIVAALIYIHLTFFAEIDAKFGHSLDRAIAFGWPILVVILPVGWIIIRRSKDDQKDLS